MRFLRIALFAVALCALAIYFSACGGGGKERTSSSVTLTSTDLIAGSGQGYPCTGTDIGQVTVVQDGTNLKVTLTCDITGDPNTQWYMHGAHLDIGASAAGYKNGVSFGLFPWLADGLSNVTAYTFTIPISGTYPDRGKNGYRKGLYNFGGTGTQLYVTAHADACHLEGYVAPHGQPGWDEVVCDGRNGDIANLCLCAGFDQHLVGGVSLSVSGSNLIVTTNTASCYTMDSVHLFIGTAPPETDNSAMPTTNCGSGPQTPNRGWQKQMYCDFGWGPFMHDGLGAATTDTFTIPLSTFGIADCVDCGGNAVGPFYFALDAAITGEDCAEFPGGGQTATSYSPQCRHIIDEGPGQFKSYDDCSLVIPACHTKTIHHDGDYDPGNPGTEVCDTAIGFDAQGNANVCKDEPGWFNTMYPTVTRWGWTFRSPRP